MRPTPDPLLPLLAAAACAALALGGCAGGPSPRSGPYGGYDRRAAGPLPFQDVGYAAWTDSEPPYRLYPGDVLDFAAPSAPELARTVTVQPDGRVMLPLIGAVMAADRAVPELDAELAAAYAPQLVDPRVELSVRQAAPLKVFVGGEVDKPGVYDMPGDIDAVQAIAMAGGLKTSARVNAVVLIRRGPGGRPMARLVDVEGAIRHPGLVDAAPLRRFDMVYAPRSAISNLALFVQQYLRDPLPIQFSYVVNGQYANTR